MFLITIIIVVLALLAFVTAKKKANTRSTNVHNTSSIGFPYQRAKQPLFTAAERSFLGVLDQAVGTEHRVFGKVRIGDVAEFKPGLSNAARQGALNRINSKHFDYVVCRTNDLSVVCAIELNDKSHASQKKHKNVTN